jgi:FkbM family methyltransferase
MKKSNTLVAILKKSLIIKIIFGSLNKLGLWPIIRSSPIFEYPLGSSANVLNVKVAFNQFGGYLIPNLSYRRPAVQAILRGKVFEPETIKFIINNVGHGDIIHAGTFFGDFLPALSLSMTGNSILWAFEPNPENFRCAQITILLNDLKNVKISNDALGDRSKKANLLVKSDNGLNLGGASKIIDSPPKENSIEVNIVRLDDVIDAHRNISILQIDVEGFEQQVLDGGMDTIKRNKPVLILEDNNGIINNQWFISNILSLGYEKYGEVHNNKIFKVAGLKLK